MGGDGWGKEMGDGRIGYIRKGDKGRGEYGLGRGVGG